LQVQLLGPFEVVVEGLASPRGVQAAGASGLLALERNRPVSSDRLIDAL